MHRRHWLATVGASLLAGCAAPDALRAQASARKTLRFGLSSCANQDAPQPVWDAVLADRLDFFVFGGDNVYASAQPFDIANLRAAYAKAETIDNFMRVRGSVPHLAVWDDHDYGKNDAGADFAHKQASKDEFLRFWRVPADDPRRARDGLYHAVTIGDAGARVQVIGLDLRWFRSPLNAPRAPYSPDPDPAKTMLGDAQWRWLEEQLRQPADVRLLVSSSQCVVEGHTWERWGNLPLERARLYKLIATTGARGVVVLSGDRHMGAIYRETTAPLPYPLYELTSSGITHPWGKGTEPGPNRIGELVTEIHYGRIDIDFAARTLTLALHGVQGARLREQVVGFDEIKV